MRKSLVVGLVTLLILAGCAGNPQTTATPDNSTAMTQSGTPLQTSTPPADLYTAQTDLDSAETLTIDSTRLQTTVRTTLRDSESFSAGHHKTVDVESEAVKKRRSLMADTVVNRTEQRLVRESVDKDWDTQLRFGEPEQLRAIYATPDTAYERRITEKGGNLMPTQYESEAVDAEGYYEERVNETMTVYGSEFIDGIQFTRTEPERNDGILFTANLSAVPDAPASEAIPALKQYEGSYFGPDAKINRYEASLLFDESGRLVHFELHFMVKTNPTEWATFDYQTRFHDFGHRAVSAPEWVQNT